MLAGIALASNRKVSDGDDRMTPWWLKRVVEGVNHDTFSSVDDPAHPLIARITTAFVEGFVFGDAAARGWFDNGGLCAAGRLAVERKTMR
jgi:hypothetical protein